MCTKIPDGGHYMIIGRDGGGGGGVRYTSLSKMWDSQLVYIINLATETGSCAWELNKSSILSDL